MCPTNNSESTMCEQIWKITAFKENKKNKHKMQDFRKKKYKIANIFHFMILQFYMHVNNMYGRLKTIFK